MGWKSTVVITRKEALELVFKRLASAHELSDNELANLVETLGYGELVGLDYYGHNFMIGEKQTQDGYITG